MKARAFLPLIAVAASSASVGCGVCDEDRVAATYDHAVVTKAAADRRVMVFAAVDGRGPAKALAASARKAAEHVPGVDRASVRSSAEPAPALSFALDRAAQTPETALQAIANRSNQAGMRLTLLKVVP